VKVIVYHTSYGCESGCCGHAVELQDDVDCAVSSRFTFDHPRGLTGDKEKLRQWVEDVIADELGKEHVKDLDWDGCTFSND